MIINYLQMVLEHTYKMLCLSNIHKRVDNIQHNTGIINLLCFTSGKCF